MREGEKLTIDLRIPSLPLAPGVYGVDVGIRSGDSKGLFYKENCCQIDVAPTSRTPTYVTGCPDPGFGFP